MWAFFVPDPAAETPLLRRLSRRGHLMKRPKPRKRHRTHGSPSGLPYLKEKVP